MKKIFIPSRQFLQRYRKLIVIETVVIALYLLLFDNTFLILLPLLLFLHRFVKYQLLSGKLEGLKKNEPYLLDQHELIKLMGKGEEK